MQIDIVLYCDTWMEFPAMYRHVEKVKKIVEDVPDKLKDDVQAILDADV